MLDYTRASLELLYNVSRELTSALDLHTVLTRVLSLSTESVQAERGSVIVMDEHQQPVDAAIIIAKRVMPHSLESLNATLEQGLAGWVGRSREAALITDTSQDPRWVRRPDDDNENSGNKSAICVPILAREELVGVLTLVHARPNFFGAEHLALLQAIADQAGIAIHNARLYETAQAANRRYYELFEDSIDPIVLTRLDGSIQETNRQAAQMSGRTRGTMLGLSISKLPSLPDEWLQDNMPAILAGSTIVFETTLEPLEGPVLPVELYVHKVQFSGEELLQWIIRNISERKQLDALRDDLSAMVYHDLRSPLANIISSLDMLRSLINEKNNVVSQQVLSIAIRSSERMQRLINSLLDINRLESGQPITSRKAVEVAPLIREALEAVQPIISTKRQQVVLEIEADLPRISIDEDMIRRVLINLLENAAKFTYVDGELAIGAAVQDSWVRLWVRDTGPGIAQEAQQLLFHKFSRIPIEMRATSERVPKGLGLGLAFCKLAVQAHGGKIDIESTAGAGSCFWFTAPLVEVTTA